MFCCAVVFVLHCLCADVCLSLCLYLSVCLPHQSVSGLQEHERSDLQISGKAHLLRGCARGIKQSTLRHRQASLSTVQPLQLQQQSRKRRRQTRILFPDMFRADSDLVAETCPSRTQRLVYGNQVPSSAQEKNNQGAPPSSPPPPPFHSQVYPGLQLPRAAPPLPPPPPGKEEDPHLMHFPPAGRKISLWQSMLSLHDETLTQPLLATERTHFQGLSLMDTPSARLELPVPAELQGLCLLRCYARANKYLSLLVMGAKNGRFAVFSVPWQGSSADELALARTAADPPASPSKSKSKSNKHKHDTEGVHHKNIMHTFHSFVIFITCDRCRRHYFHVHHFYN